MLYRDDRAYFLQREQQCRAQAVNADDPAVSRVHLDFAARYRRAAEKLAYRLFEAA